MSVRARAAAFDARAAAPIDADATPTRDGARGRATTIPTMPPTTTPPPTTTTTAHRARDDDDATASCGTASSARGVRATAREVDARAPRGDAARFERAFEKACDALALARAIEATVRRETAWAGRAAARARARARSAAAARAYDAVAERRDVDDDAGRATPTAREGEAADASMSVVRSFSFARDDEDDARGDDEEEEDDGRATDATARETFEDDVGDSHARALREIARARREIANVLDESRKAAARARSRRVEDASPTRAGTRTVASRRRDVDKTRVEKTIVMDRIAMIDGLLAALDEA